MQMHSPHNYRNKSSRKVIKTTVHPCPYCQCIFPNLSKVSYNSGSNKQIFIPNQSQYNKINHLNNHNFNNNIRIMYKNIPSKKVVQAITYNSLEKQRGGYLVNQMSQYNRQKNSLNLNKYQNIESVPSYHKILKGKQINKNQQKYHGVSPKNKPNLIIRNFQINQKTIQQKPNIKIHNFENIPITIHNQIHHEQTPQIKKILNKITNFQMHQQVDNKKKKKQKIKMNKFVQSTKNHSILSDLNPVQRNKNILKGQFTFLLKNNSGQCNDNYLHKLDSIKLNREQKQLKYRINTENVLQDKKYSKQFVQSIRNKVIPNKQSLQLTEANKSELWIQSAQNEQCHSVQPRNQSKRSRRKNSENPQQVHSLVTFHYIEQKEEQKIQQGSMDQKMKKKNQYMIQDVDINLLSKKIDLNYDYYKININDSRSSASLSLNLGL